jgi:hypothetical protein
LTDITIATWNMHHGMDRRRATVDQGWAYLREGIAPTVALVQEAAEIPVVPGQAIESRAGDLRYRTGVVGYGVRVEPVPELRARYLGSSRVAIAPRVEATLALGMVTSNSFAPFVAISMYGRIEGGYAQTNVLRAVADLIPLFDSRAYGNRVVLGGDLNVYDQTGDLVMKDRWQAIVRLIESLGLINLAKLTQPQRGRLKGCPCNELDCYHVTTFRHRNSRAGSRGFMNDYLFATRDLAKGLSSFKALDNPEVRALSDHAPLIAKFDLS